MRWEIETWRKLYTRIPPGWTLLPLSARSLSSELIKYCDDDGRIPIGCRPAGEAIAHLLGAHTGERKRVYADVDALVKDGYLILEPEHVVIKNFKQAQDRTPAAKRIHEKRQAARAAAESQKKGASTTQTDNSSPPPRDDLANTSPTPRQHLGQTSEAPSDLSVGINSAAPRTVPNKSPDPVPVPDPVPDINTKRVAKPTPKAPKAPKPETTIQIAWRCWRETYSASNRGYGTYTDSPEDGAVIAKLAAHADGLTASAGRGDVESLLRHWFRSYMRDAGGSNFLVSKRHALRFLPSGIPTYGTPWSARAQPKQINGGAYKILSFDDEPSHVTGPIDQPEEKAS